MIGLQHSNTTRPTTKSKACGCVTVYIFIFAAMPMSTERLESVFYWVDLTMISVLGLYDVQKQTAEAQKLSYVRIPDPQDTIKVEH